jgi:hypothetical protein
MSAVSARRDELRSIDDRVGEPDPVATQLAAQLDAAASRVREMADRRELLRRRVLDAQAELDQARSDADEAERAVRSPAIDRSVVQRLETVRDEIFEVDDRQSVLAAARNKRRLAELRSEEAILLDRLGFDTYSSYVMGIPSMRAEMERSAQIDAAREHADRMEARLVSMQQEAPGDAEVADAAVQLHRLLAQATTVLGEEVGPRGADELARELAEGGDAAGLVHGVSLDLRARRVVAPERIDEATAALESALAEVSAAAAAVRFDLPVGPTTLSEPPAPPDPAAPGSPADLDLSARADAWLDWFERLRSWVRSTEVAVVELERRIAELGTGAESGRMGRWAEVEAELDEALDRLATAQDRVRSHEEATARLAELRIRELELRDTERELLEQIAATEAAVVPPPPPPPPPPQAPPVEGERTRSGLDAGVDEDDPDAVEWAVVARLARQRAVSFVGSLPLLLDGLPDDPDVRAAVLRRLDRMSDLVQVVVVSDDDAAAAWAAGLGARGDCIEL